MKMNNFTTAAKRTFRMINRNVTPKAKRLTQIIGITITILMTLIIVCGSMVPALTRARIIKERVTSEINQALLPIRNRKKKKKSSMEIEETEDEYYEDIDVFVHQVEDIKTKSSVQEAQNQEEPQPGTSRSPTPPPPANPVLPVSNWEFDIGGPGLLKTVFYSCRRNFSGSVSGAWSEFRFWFKETGFSFSDRVRGFFKRIKDKESAPQVETTDWDKTPCDAENKNMYAASKAAYLHFSAKWQDSKIVPCEMNPDWFKNPVWYAHQDSVPIESRMSIRACVAQPALLDTFPDCKKNFELYLETTEEDFTSYTSLLNKIKAAVPSEAVDIFFEYFPLLCILFQAFRKKMALSFSMAIVEILKKWVPPERRNVAITAGGLITYLIFKTVGCEKKDRQLRAKVSFDLTKVSSQGMQTGLSVLIVLFMGLILWKIPMKNDFDSVFNRFGRAGPNIRGIEEATSWAQGNAEQFVDWFGAKYLNKELKDPLKKLRRKLKEYDHPDFIKRMNADTNLTTDVFLTYLEWTEYIDSLTPKSRRDVEPYTRRINEFKKKAQASPAAGVNFKAEPPVVLLSGNPGVGKTTCIPYICASHLIHTGVLNAQNFKDDGSDFLGPWVYYAKTSDKHWTGYNSLKTKITVFDDANQAVPDAVEGIPLPVLLIHYANSAPTHIPQASLEDKENNSYFNGGLIILSDNVEKPDLKKVLLCEEAYTRRLDLVAEVIANPNYPVIRKVMGSKEWDVPAFDMPGRPRTDAWSFVIKDPVAGRVLETVDFETFVGKVNALYDKKRSNFQSNNRDLARFVSNLMPKSAVYAASALGWVAMKIFRRWVNSPTFVIGSLVLGMIYWPLAAVALALKMAVTVTAPKAYVPGNDHKRDLKRLAGFLFALPVIYYLWKLWWKPTHKHQTELVEAGLEVEREIRSREFVAANVNGILGDTARLENKISDYFEDCQLDNGNGYVANTKLKLEPVDEEVLNNMLQYKIEEFKFLTGKRADLPYLWQYMEENSTRIPTRGDEVRNVADELVVKLNRHLPVDLDEKKKEEMTSIVEEVLLSQGRVKAKSYQGKNTYAAAKESRTKLTKSLQTKVYAGTDTSLVIQKCIPLKAAERFTSETLCVPDVEPQLERYLERYDKFAFDQNLRDFLTNKVAKATYAVRLLGGKKLPTLNCVFIKGNLAVAPRHFFYGLEDYTTLELVQADGRNKTHVHVPLDQIKLFPIGEDGYSKDTCYFYVPPRFIRRHADLTKSFYTRKEINDKYRNRFFIYGYKMDAQDLSIHMACTTGAYHNKVVGLCEAVGVNCLVLNLFVQDGICGSILGSMSGNRTHQLFGIVNGGDVSTTVCNIITQEEICMVGKHLAELGIDNGAAEDLLDSSLEPFCRPYVDDALFDFSNMRNTGTLICKAFVSPNTKFVPSPIYELFGEATTKPVNIGGRTREMEKKCFSKYDTEQVVVPMTDLAIFRMNVARRLAGATPYVTDIDKAIRGDPETGIQPMNRKTSPGFPWLEFGRNAGKKEWLGENEDWIIHEDLIAAVQQSEEKARNGITEFIVWMDQYKDERLPIQKVDNGKIRLFAIGPLHFNILCRKYLIWAMEHLILHKIENGSLVGIDPEAHFKALYSKIQEVNDPHSACMIAGDYSNFDGSLARPFLHEIGDVLASMMEEEDAVALRSVWEALISSNHVFRGHIYSLSQSQPSGNIFTTHLNTLYNLAIIEMVIIRAAQAADFYPEENDFKVFAYGDDNIIVFSKRFIEAVPEKALQVIPSMMAKYGHTYTTDSKDSQYFEYRPITDITILKRNFLIEDRHVFAPLCLSTVLERNYWMAKTRDEQVVKEQMEMNLYTTYLDLAQHRLPIFNQYAKTVREKYVAFGGDKMEIALTHEQLRLLSVRNSERAEQERQYKLKAFSTLHTKCSEIELAGAFWEFVEETDVWMGTHDTFAYTPSACGTRENVVMGFHNAKASVHVNVRHDGAPCDRKEILIDFFVNTAMKGVRGGLGEPFPIRDGWVAFENQLPVASRCRCNEHPFFRKPKPCTVEGFVCIGPKHDFEENILTIIPHDQPLSEAMYLKACDSLLDSETDVLHCVDYTIKKAEHLKPKSDNNIPEVQKILETQDVEAPDMQTLEGATETPHLDREIGEEKQGAYSVCDIMERKWQLGTVLVNSGSAPGTVVYTAHFPNVLFENHQIMRMISNFIHFRADFEIEIIATVNPQVAWAVRCFIAPDLDPNFLRNRTGTLLQQSQYVNSIMKGPSQPRMQIMLPWVSQFSHRNLATTTGNAGTFYIAPITQADGPVNLAIYVTMKNVELQYPVEHPIVYLKDSHKKHAYKTLGYKVVSGEQIKPKGLLTLLAGEAKNVLSAGLAAGINAGVTSIGKIPVIGPLASTALTRYASSNCKPLSDEPSHRVTIRPVPDNVNIQGLELATNFGLDTLNSVSHDVGVAGTSGDDMSFERFYTHPNYIASFSVSASDPVGKSLLRIPIWPFNGRSQSEDTAMPQTTLSINRLESGVYWMQFVGATDIITIGQYDHAAFAPSLTILNESGNVWAVGGAVVSIATTATTWSMTSQTGTITGNLPARGTPYTRVMRVAPQTTTVERITFQEYVASPFTYWNGRMKFDIYLALTAFHSVKLRVVEVYGMTDATLDGNTVGAYPSTIHEFGVSDFVQITTAAPSTFNFKVNPAAVSDDFTPTIATSVGFIEIMVEVPLEHPTSVSGTVSGWVEQSFVDMVVGVPRTPDLVPVLGDISLEPVQVKFRNLGEVDAEKDEDMKRMVKIFRTNNPKAGRDAEFAFHHSYMKEVEAEKRKTSGLKTKSDVRSLRPEGAKLKEERFGGGTVDEPRQVAIPREICFGTFGEHISSFAELAKVYSGSIGFERMSTPQVVIINTLNYAQTALGHSNFMLQQDYIQCAYGFFKGSMSLRIIPTSGNLRVKWHALFPISGGSRMVRYITNDTNLNVGEGIPDRNIVYINSLEGACHIRVPSYNPFSILRNSPTAISQGPTQPIPGCVSFTLPANTGVAVYMAFGDDRRCYQPVGLPPFQRVRRNDFGATPIAVPYTGARSDTVEEEILNDMLKSLGEK